MGGQGGVATTTSTGGDGGTGPGGGAGGAGGTGGSCEGGGAAGTLVSRGLIARYFFDEASQGTGPTMLDDAAPAPLDLPITYAGGNVFSQADCRRGMTWPAASGDGRADVLVAGTKVETELDGSTTGTIECVIELIDADPSSSRISHIGTDTQPGRFTMFSDGPTSLGFDWDDQAGLVMETVEHWTVDHLALGRLVAHIVLDTNLASPSDRVRLYVNGVDQGPGDILETPIAQGAATEIIAATDSFSIGNRAIGGRSIDGTIFYCAIYGAALSSEEIGQNATALMAGDDTP